MLTFEFQVIFIEISQHFGEKDLFNNSGKSFAHRFGKSNKMPA